jgi:O-antigen/teichoic acid export membrane protein
MPAILGLLLGLLIAIVATLFFPEYTHLYRQGQIDAVNGKVLFELKPQPDGTTTWERKK